MDKVRRQPMPPKSEFETDRYWGDRPVDAIERGRRLMSGEIETLDSVFRDSPAIGHAWVGIYGGEDEFAHSWDYEGDYLWHFLRLKDLLDEARAAVWSAGAEAGVRGAEDPNRAELERNWINMRMRPSLPAWLAATADALAAPGPIWGAVFAVEAAVLAFATATLDPERVIIRPWEAAIEAIPEWRPSPSLWPWMTSGTLVF
jgi:hypothetical protein